MRSKAKMHVSHAPPLREHGRRSDGPTLLTGQGMKNGGWCAEALQQAKRKPRGEAAVEALPLDRIVVGADIAPTGVVQQVRGIEIDLEAVNWDIARRQANFAIGRCPALVVVENGSGAKPAEKVGQARGKAESRPFRRTCRE